MLKQNNIRLRPLECSDLDFLFDLENDKSIWPVTGTTVSFSKETLANYINNAQQDIAIAGQFRFVIDLKGKPIGCIDIFEYDRKKESLKIPNTTFSNINKDGILDIFELYNFTVDEHEDIEKVPKKNV